MATFHKGPTRPKSFRYTRDEVLVPIGIILPDRHPRLPHSPSDDVVRSLIDTDGGYHFGASNIHISLPDIPIQ
jgi:hypothetical protein